MEDTLFFIFILFKDFIDLFLERREGREKERETHIDVGEKSQSIASCIHPYQEPGPVAQAFALTLNPSGDLLLCRTVLNQLSHADQGRHCK